VLERVVEHWLTKAGERTYEIPFTQLLIAEGYTVLHGPVHHAYEHGKDIIAYSPEGALCAFQLKGGDIGLSELDDHQGQLLTLVATAVQYPGIEPPRRPDRAFLVTNGTLTPPARDRLAAINAGYRTEQRGPIELVEKEQLLSRFRHAYGQYIPTEVHELNALFRLLTESGESLPELKEFSRLQRGILLLAASQKSPRKYVRANAAALLLTAYAIGPWQRASNYLAEAEAWLTLAVTILHTAGTTPAMDEKDWLETYQLALASANDALARLLDEAVSEEDLVVPHLMDGYVYPSRAVLICGFASALLLAEKITGSDSDIREKVSALLRREFSSIRMVGEVAVPFLLTIASALDEIGETQLAANLVGSCARSLSAANAPQSENALPDPYHSFEACMSAPLDETSIDPTEHFAGRSFGLPLALEWLARRDLRAVVEPFWRAVTHITFCEFEPSSAINLLVDLDEEGTLRSWHAEQPQSWGQFVSAARRLRESTLPPILWKRSEVIPYLGLLFPYRFVLSIAKAVDYYSTPAGTVEITSGTDATPTDSYDPS
jgi:hypothetical protein